MERAGAEAGLRGGEALRQRERGAALLGRQVGVARGHRQTVRFADDRRILARLRDLLAMATAVDPKAEALEALLTARAVKTIVFTDAQPTARYLLQRLHGRYSGSGVVFRVAV